MTYPPQQPGPYGQDPYGQQQPYGQQPPYGQPQQPYGGQYGQTPWSGQQPGFPVGPPPTKKRGGLIASLIIVAILVVGGGGVGLYFLLSNDKKENSADGGGGDDDKNTPRAAANAYVKALQTALNTQDLDDVDLKPLKPLACKDDYEQLEDSLEAAKESQETTSPEDRPEIEVTIEDFKESKNGATFTMVRTRDDDTGKVDMDVTKKGGSYEVCGLTAADEGGGSGPTTSRPIPNPIPTT